MKETTAGWISSRTASLIPTGGALDITLQEWSHVLAINLTGYFLCIQHPGKMMLAQGAGSIINISAGSAERSSPAEAAIFLVSDKASYITNTILPVDGGRPNSMNSGSAR